MTEISIDVTGAHTVRLPAERGVVHATVSQEGPQQAPVVSGVTAAVAQVRSGIDKRYDADAGPITNFAVDQIRTGAHRPWHEQRRLPLVYTASVTVTATFSDFAELGAWVSSSASVTGFAVSHIDWELTPEHLEEVERDTRKAALLAAKTRAQDYSDALELGPVEIRSISDPGVVNVSPKMMRMAAMDAESAGGSVDLVPEEIEVHAEVNARFVV